MRTDAGVPGQGNEVCDVTSTGPFSIPAGDSIAVAFAILAGQDLATIQSAADAAQIKFDLFLGLEEIAGDRSFNLEQNFPNPVRTLTTFRFSLSESGLTELSIFNSLGEKVRTLVMEKLASGNYSTVVDLSSLGSGIYYCHLTSGSKSMAHPFSIMH
jgi:hypothetical protein